MSDASVADAMADGSHDAGPFASPDQPGPLQVDEHLGEMASASISVDYFVPRTAGVLPIVFLRHGYTRAPKNLHGWGTYLASHGFIVALPSTTDSGNAQIGETDLETAVTYTLAQAAAPASFLFGAVDAARVVLGGHSSGGLAATLTVAAKKVPAAGLVLLDNEGSTEGNTAAAMIAVPSVGAYAAPDNSPGPLSCNEQGTGVNAADALTGSVLSFRVKNASHCDLESDSDVGCAAACGASSATRLAAFETYVTAFLMLAFQCETRALPFVTGSILAADARVTVLSQRMLPPRCL